MNEKRDPKSKKPKNNSKYKNDSKTLKIIKILLWPFKIIFMILSWIVKIIILGIEKLIELFKKSRKASQERIENTKKKDKYEEFKTKKNINGTFKDFEKFLLEKDSTIGIILGARGTGKSAFGLKLLENLHALNNRKIFALGFKTSELPTWIKTIDDINNIENNSYVLIDEGGILFNSRQGFSDGNQLLSKLLLIARHKDLSILFISQNSSNLEINAIRQTDYLILKPSALLQLDFERKKIKEVYLEASKDFSEYKDTIGLTYIYSDKFRGFVTNPLPTFWSQKISKNFSGKNKE